MQSSSGMFQLYIHQTRLQEHAQQQQENASVQFFLDEDLQKTTWNCLGCWKVHMLPGPS